MFCAYSNTFYMQGYHVKRHNLSSMALPCLPPPHADPDGSIRKAQPQPVGQGGMSGSQGALPTMGGSVAAQAWARLTHRVPEYTGAVGYDTIWHVGMRDMSSVLVLEPSVKAYGLWCMDLLRWRVWGRWCAAAQGMFTELCFSCCVSVHSSVRTSSNHS